MTAPGFDHVAGVASGSDRRAAVATYRVVVSDDRLRLSPHPANADAVVLDVPVARVRAGADGWAGGVRLEIDGAPLRLDFARDGAASSVAPGPRLTRALAGRRARRRFAAALRDAP